MRSTVQTLIFFFALFTLIVSNQCAKPKVTIYYESLCSDTQRFFTRQFYPTYTKLQGEFELELVPYGKAIHNYVNGKWEFDCQHGADECYGNKIQACLIKDDSVVESDKLKFINCLMADRQPIYATSKCAQLVGADPVKYMRCADSNVGDNYLAEYGDITDSLRPKLAFVPTIVFNDVYKQADQSLALSNFQKALCKYFTSPPADCQ